MSKEKKEKAIVKAEQKPIEKKEPEPQEIIKPMTITEKVVSMLNLAGSIEFTEEQREILFSAIKDEDVEIRPDGQVYLPWVFYVQKLKEAFKGKSSLMPATPMPAFQNNLMLWGFYLVIDGKPYAYAVGQQEYHANNPTMTYGDAIEGAKSNALMRLCKDIGIGLELWKPEFIKGWKAKYAYQYETWDNNKGRKVLRWAKKTNKKNEVKDIEPQENFDEDEEQPIEEEIKAEQVPDGEDLLVGQGDQEKELEAMANNLNQRLETMGVDEKAFKAWLYDYQVSIEPPRRYIRKHFGNPSFRAGDLEDLKHLDSHLAKAVEKFKKVKPGASKKKEEKPKKEQKEMFK